MTRAGFADLSGLGGLYATGRWHDRPMRVLYSASSRALAMLETLVHLDVPFEYLPADFVFQVIDLPDSELERVESTDIPAAQGPAVFGRRWLNSGRSLGLVVPSAIIAREPNVLINPPHAAIAKLGSRVESDVVLDARLFADQRA